MYNNEKMQTASIENYVKHQSLICFLIIQISLFQSQTKEKVLVEEESSKKRVENVMKNLNLALV